MRIGFIQRRESVGKASGKIPDACRGNSAVAIPELAVLVGITVRSVERNIRSLRAKGLLRRLGGRKEGRWGAGSETDTESQSCFRRRIKLQCHEHELRLCRTAPAWGGAAMKGKQP